MLKSNKLSQTSAGILCGLTAMALGGISIAHAEPSLQIDILSLTTSYDDVNDDVVTQNS